MEKKGRPKRTQDELKRTIKVSVYFSEFEYKQIKTYCGKYKISSTMRDLILDKCFGC